MPLEVRKTELAHILPIRQLFLQETNFQIRYHASHERGWTDSYLITLDEVAVGYGSVMGQEIENRDTIFEFYLVPPYRRCASRAFQELIAASKVPLIECQSNDLLLTAMLFEFGENIEADVVLFADNVVTEYEAPGVVFRRRHEDDAIFAHNNGIEPGDYVLEDKGEVVATGGFLLHYNIPFADLYMEVKEAHRQKGFGSFLVQELKRECYLAGRVPAARCSIRNKASWATLCKAGFKLSGFMLKGRVQ